MRSAGFFLVLPEVAGPCAPWHPCPAMDADLSTPRPMRIGVVLFVALLHVAAVLALIRAFAPDFTAQVVEDVTEAFTVTITAPSPTPSATPSPIEAAPAGNEGAAGRKAQPRAAEAPRPKVTIAKKSAPPVAGTGTENAAGAREGGEGTGAGQAGSGSGAGGSGDGTGGGAAKAVKIAGEINSARDYPRASRDQRLGDHVVIALTVGTDGRVKACRIVRASRDAEADRITCALATSRFRFRPATDRAGNPVASVFGGKQRWFQPGSD